MSELPWEVVSGLWLKACKQRKGVSGWRGHAGGSDTKMGEDHGDLWSCDLTKVM